MAKLFPMIGRGIGCIKGCSNPKIIRFGRRSLIFGPAVGFYFLETKLTCSFYTNCLLLVIRTCRICGLRISQSFLITSFLFGSVPIEWLFVLRRPISF